MQYLNNLLLESCQIWTVDQWKVEGQVFSVVWVLKERWQWVVSCWTLKKKILKCRLQWTTNQEANWMSLPLAVRRWLTQKWSSKLKTSTKELTRGRQDLWNNLYDRLFDPSHPKCRVCSLINFQPQALSTDMSLLRPVDCSNNFSCSNQQRTTAQARFVVTKKGK